jgi:hypothetical protein
MRFSLLAYSTKKIFTTLLILDLTMIALHWITLGEFSFFHLNGERNLPSTYSALKLVSIGVLVFVLFKKLPWKKYWHIGIATLIPIYLAIDEWVQVHDTSKNVRADKTWFFDVQNFCDQCHSTLNWLNLTPFILMAMLIAYIFIYYALPFARTHYKIFVLGVTIYVTGFLGLEWVGVAILANDGPKWLYEISYTFEELLELLGQTVMIYYWLLIITAAKQKYENKTNLTT